MKLAKLRTERFHARALLFSLTLPLMLSWIGSSSALAQANAETNTARNKLSRTTLSYVFSFPTASTANFLGNSVSYRGVGLDWNSPTGWENLYVGFSFRWLYFTHDEDQGVLTSGNTTLTGRIYRSVESFPLTLSFKYPIMTASSSPFVPFVGLGIGTTYGRKELNIGAFSQNQFGWQFLMAPEVGTEIKFSRTSDINGFFNVRYDAGFGSGAVDAISNLSLAIGIASNFD